MERAENKVSSQAGGGGNTRGLEVANLTDHNYVRRLAQDGAQRRRKCHPDVRIHLHLVDPVHLIFNWLLDRDDLSVRFIDVIEARVKRARFARASRPGNEKNAVRK